MSLNEEGLFNESPSDVAEGIVIVAGSVWWEGKAFHLYWFEALLTSRLEGGRGWFVISRVESMSIVLLIRVGKLDEVGNWEVTIVEAVVIAEVTTAVSVVGSIGGSSRYSSSSAPPSSPSSSLEAGGTACWNLRTVVSIVTHGNFRIQV